MKKLLVALFALIFLMSMVSAGKVISKDPYCYENSRSSLSITLCIEKVNNPFRSGDTINVTCTDELYINSLDCNAINNGECSGTRVYTDATRKYQYRLTEADDGKSFYFSCMEKDASKRNTWGAVSTPVLHYDPACKGNNKCGECGNPICTGSGAVGDNSVNDDYDEPESKNIFEMISDFFSSIWDALTGFLGTGSVVGNDGYKFDGGSDLDE